MAFFFFLIGGGWQWVRAELLTPQLDVMQTAAVQQLFTMHGTIMILPWIIPFFCRVGQLLPAAHAGRERHGVPLLNAFAFWLIPRRACSCCWAGSQGKPRRAGRAIRAQHAV